MGDGTIRTSTPAYPVTPRDTAEAKALAAAVRRGGELGVDLENERGYRSIELYNATIALKTNNPYARASCVAAGNEAGFDEYEMNAICHEPFKGNPNAVKQIFPFP